MKHHWTGLVALGLLTLGAPMASRVTPMPRARMGFWIPRPWRDELITGWGCARPPKGSRRLP